MKQALYRRYRSKSFDAVVGQDHITSSLGKSISAGKIAHAYLLTGPKGVGKTSVARIIAHAVNQLPYTDEHEHLDIIEIDAASNRRIDEIRDLREKVHIAPSSATYKVYIIDEVHMLTKEAFNALLKTLEEPPEHVIFILATTEAHKVPATIVSRTQQFHFRAVDEETVAKHLSTIAKEEGLSVDESALRLIARYGNGSFRDSIGLLDQVSSGHQVVSEQMVSDTIGFVSRETIRELLVALDEHNSAEVVTFLDKAHSNGLHAKPLAQQIIAALRDEFSSSIRSDRLNLIEELLEVESSMNPEAKLEITLLRSTISETAPINPQAKSTAEKPKTSIMNQETTETTRKTKQKAKVPAESSHRSEPINDDHWQKLLSAVKSQNPSLYSMLRLADARGEGDDLELRFLHAFHAKRMQEAKYKTLITNILREIDPRDWHVTSVHDTTVRPRVETMQPTPMNDDLSIERNIEVNADDDTVGTIMGVFGGGEVVDA